MRAQQLAGQQTSQTQPTRSPQGAQQAVQGQSVPSSGSAAQPSAPTQYGHCQQASQAATAAQQAVPVQDHASTSVNIAILDSKDFPSDVAPPQELHSEFAMADGRVLFECPGLVKATGIDLMNCPLNVILKLRVRRKSSTGAMILWHVVLPLPLISKYLLNPPHEWETWIGLFPNTQVLEAHPADHMFTQAVHLISRPEFPKLRLRFTYHNPELQERLSAQREMQEQESQRRKEFTQKMGRAQFEEIQKLTRTARDGSGPSGHDTPPPRNSYAVAATSASGPIATMTPSGQHGDLANGIMPQSPDDQDKIQEALHSALRFTQCIQQMLVQHSHNGHTGALAVQPPPPLTSSEVFSSKTPASLVDAHCAHLQRCLMHQQSSTPSLVAQHAGFCEAEEAEPMLAEGLRMALMGMLEDSDNAKIPRTATNLSAASNDQLSSIQGRFPHLWDAYREVSAVAKERAGLLEEAASAAKERAMLVEQKRKLQEQASTLQQECTEQRAQQHREQHRAPIEAAQQAESKKQFEKLLAQQRQALQLGFDAEMRELKQQYEEARRSLQDREREVTQLRSQLGDTQRQQRM